MRFIICLTLLAVVQTWMTFATAEELVQRGTAGLMLHHQPFAKTNGLSKRHAQGTW